MTRTAKHKTSSLEKRRHHRRHYSDEKRKKTASAKSPLDVDQQTCARCGYPIHDKCFCYRHEDYDHCDYDDDQCWFADDGSREDCPVPLRPVPWGGVQVGTVGPGITFTTDATTGNVYASPSSAFEAFVADPLIGTSLVGDLVLIGGLAAPNDVYNMLFVVTATPSTANPVYTLKGLLLDRVVINSGIAVAYGPQPLIYTITAYNRQTGQLVVAPTTNRSFTMALPKYAVCRLGGEIFTPDYTQPMGIDSDPACISYEDSDCSSSEDDNSSSSSSSSDDGSGSSSDSDDSSSSSSSD